MEITEEFKTVKGSRAKGTTSVRLNKVGYLICVNLQGTILEKTQNKIPYSVIIQKALENYKDVIKLI